MKLSTLFFAVLLGLISTAALADKPAPAAGTAGGPMKGGMCQQNAQECQQLAAKFDQWCSANADKCTAMKAHMEKHVEWCEQNKEKCEKMMQRMHKHHEDEEDQDEKHGDDEDDTSSPPN